MPVEMLCRYRKASARVHIFQDRPRPGSMTPSEASDDDRDDEILPEVSLRFNNIVFRDVINTLIV